MVGLDTSSPPVIFVVGTAGAGKSSLVTSFQRWSRFIETEAIAVNLDPGAERVHYDAEFDVRDVISLTEVMNEYDLGPNGAQILAADLVAAQALDVAEELHALSGELIIIGTPGQVELFAFREASSHLIEVLGQDQAAIIYLSILSDQFQVQSRIDPTVKRNLYQELLQQLVMILYQNGHTQATVTSQGPVNWGAVYQVQFSSAALGPIKVSFCT